jgi:hypothetical protein
MRAVLAALALVLAVPATAAAAPRYAAPDGMGTACTVDAKCSIDTAVSGASDDGEVIVTSGDYGSLMMPLSSTITGTAARLNVHGEDGKPRPRIFTNAAVGLDVHGTGEHVRDLEIDQVSQIGNAVGFNFDGAEATRVIVHNNSSNGVACVILAGSVLSDSVCDETGQGGWGVRGYNQNPATNHCVLRNVTALAPAGAAIAVVSATGVDEDITVTNTIAHGGGPSNGSDVYALKQSGGGIARVTLDHSSYFIQSTSPGNQPGGIVKDNGGNVRNPAPKFAAPGDFHEGAGSPTIDKGLADAANGPTDVDGDPRSLGLGGPDIGADEFVPAPAAVTGAATGVTTSSAVLNGTVNPNTIATTYHFEYGPTTSYGSSTSSADAGAGGADVPVSAALTGLSAGATLHYRVVAVSRGGTATGADQTVTTTTPGGGGGGGGGGASPPRFVGALSLQPALFRAASRGASVSTARRHPIGTTVKFRLSEAATVRFRVERARPGNRVKGRCVKPARANRHARKCIRYVLLPGGGFTVVASAGQTSFHFTGRLRNRKLPVGGYRLRAVATDAAGSHSSAKRARFAIARL